MSVGIIDGNIAKMFIVNVTLSPALIAQATTAEQTLTVTGLKTGDFVFANKPTAQAGLGIVGFRVSAADTLAVTFCNVPAGGNITPTASQVYTILVVRPEGSPPSSIVA